MSYCKTLTVGLAALSVLCSISTAAIAAPLEFTGKVLTSQGSPAAGATVRFLSLACATDQIFSEETVTAKNDGSFHIFVPENEIKKSSGICHNNVLFAQNKNETALVNMYDDQFKNKTIRLIPSVSVKFVAIDENNRPMEGAPIALEELQTKENTSSNPWGEYAGAPWKATTDKNGVAVISGVPIAKIARFTVLGENCSSLEDITLHSLIQAVPPQTVRVSKSGVISGRVYYANTNKPAVGMRVDAVASGIGRTLSVYTDSNGVYTVAKAIPSTYTIQPVLYGAPSEEWAAKWQTGIRIKAGEKLEAIDFPLQKGAVLTGKITDKKTGGPVKEFRIDVQPENEWNGFPNIAIIHNDGTYKLHIAPGPVSIQAYQESRGWPSANDAIHITLKDGETKTMDFSIDAVAPHRKIDGVALDANGKPLPGAEIQHFSAGQPPEISIADKDGKFEFSRVRTGDMLAASLNGRSVAAPVLVSDGDSEIKLALASSEHFVTGTVVDQDGKPLKNAIVSVEYWATGDKGNGFELKSVVADSKGAFSFGPIYAGMSYSSNASGDGYSSTWSKIFAAEKDSDHSVGQMRVAKLDGVVSGIVVDRGNKPIAYAKVCAQEDYEHFTLTDTEGRFTLKQFPRGKTKVSLSVVLNGYFMTGCAMANSGDKNIKITMPNLAAH